MLKAAIDALSSCKLPKGRHASQLIVHQACESAADSDAAPPFTAADLSRATPKKPFNRFEAPPQASPWWYQAVPACLSIGYLCFPSVSSIAFSAFLTECFDDGECYLRADYALHTHTALPDGSGFERTTEYGRVLVVAWVTIWIYAVAVPLGFSFALWRARAGLRSGQPTAFSHSIRFLHQGLRHEFFYFEVIYMAHQLFIVGFAVLIVPGSTLQLLLALVTAVAMLTLRLQTAPYLSRSTNLVSVCSSLALVSTLLTCVFIRMDALVNQVEESSPALLDDSDVRTYSIDPLVLSYLLFGSTLGLSVLAGCVDTILFDRVYRDRTTGLLNKARFKEDCDELQARYMTVTVTLRRTEGPLHGHCVPVTWLLPALHVPVTWPSHDRHMAVTWPSHGRHMVITRPPHARHTPVKPEVQRAAGGRARAERPRHLLVDRHPGLQGRQRQDQP